MDYVKGIAGSFKRRILGSQDDDGGAEEANDVGGPTLLLQTVCKLSESPSEVPRAPCFLHTALTPCLLSSAMRPHPHRFLKRSYGHLRRAPHHDRIPRW
jgi:hypothetical protein